MDIVIKQKEQRERLHPHKFTLWLAIASILMAFAGLTSAFIVKSNLVKWSGVQIPYLFYISTAVIVASSLTLHLALRQFRQRKMQDYRLLMGLTIVLGVAFVVLQWFGFVNIWQQQEITFRGSAGAGQFLYIIFGLHAIHVIGGIIALVIMFLKAFFGKVKLYSAVPVEVMATYWHFVDILWIYLLLFFILIG